jgi:uncharacterized membrane protein YhaH (DUF805 family)
MQRINRKTFWIGVVFVVAVALLISTVQGGLPRVTACAILVLILVGPARMHDIGLSGWYVLVPIVAGLALLAVPGTPALLLLGILITASDAPLLAGVALLGAIPGQRKVNRFGAPSRAGLRIVR